MRAGTAGIISANSKKRQQKYKTNSKASKYMEESNKLQ